MEAQLLQEEVLKNIEDIHRIAAESIKNDLASIYQN